MTEERDPRGPRRYRRPRFRRVLVPMAGLALGATALTACQLPGATFTVTTTADGVDAAPGDGVCETATGNGVCTLRAAVMEANLTAGPNNVQLGDGATYVLTIAGRGEDGGATGDVDVSGPIAINGRSIIDAGSLDRVLDVRTGTLILDGPTIRGGLVPKAAESQGGGIRVAAAANLLTLGVTIEGNQAWRSGGGIYSAGSVQLLASTVRNNSTVGLWDLNEPIDGADGAGIAMRSAPLVVTDSTIAENRIIQIGAGAGISVYPGTTSAVTIERSTISGNSAWYAAAISASFNSVTVRQSTITGNLGSADADIVAGTISVRSSTLASGYSPVVYADTSSVAGSIIFSSGPLACYSAMTSTGYNVVSGTSCGFAAVGDTSSADPLLLALANNGGPTQTRLPGPGSIVINAIPVGVAGLCDGSAPTDQRGVARPQGTACDIGAVERTP